LTPLELDQLEFYRIEYMLKNFEDALDEEEKHYKKQEKEQEKSYKKQQSSMSPANYGGFKLPKVELPKINMPHV
jgi:hypothetical protein